MIEPIKLTIKERLPDVDFIKLTNYCIPYPSDEGGGFYRSSSQGNVFHLHPVHIRGARILLKKLNIEPNIAIEERPQGETSIKSPDGRAGMSVSFEIIENGFIAHAVNGDYFVPKLYVDTLLEVIKEECETDNKVAPRRIWARLIEKYNLFPEYAKAIKIIQASTDVGIAEKDAIITALHQHRASLFEGMRVRKKEDVTKTYYSMYWFPTIYLKRQGVIDQYGTREIYLKQQEIT